MKVTLTGVVQREISAKFSVIADALVARINEEIASTILGAMDFEISFCPVVVPAESALQRGYKSRLDRKGKIFYCCAHIDMDHFSRGETNSRVNLLAEGLKEASGNIPALADGNDAPSIFLQCLEAARLGTKFDGLSRLE